ncbi:MAG: glycosyltransferase family 4 protein, partial [Symbiobacteriaceae bacterium]
AGAGTAVVGRPEPQGATGSPTGHSGTSARSGGGHTLRHQFIQWLKRARMYVLIPDDRILWYPVAVREGRRMLARYGADALLSTSGPYTNHLVGLALHRRSRLPWVADFRDPWTQNLHRSGIAWREALEERMERAVMREADVVLTVTRSFAEGFRQKYDGLIRRLEVIHNGFDAADFRDIEPERVPGKCTFVYTGIFYKERHPRHLLRAVRELIDSGEIDRERVRLRFAGVFDYPGYSENADAVRDLGLEDVVEVLGHVPHRRALALLKGADVLLLINDVHPDFGTTFIPGKLFEYMAVQRPILAMSLPGEAASIIQRFGLGEVVPPEDVAAIKEAVRRFYRRWQAGELQEPRPLPAEAYRLYERREQARALAELLDELVQRQRA